MDQHHNIWHLWLLAAVISIKISQISQISSYGLPIEHNLVIIKDTSVHINAFFFTWFTQGFFLQFWEGGGLGPFRLGKLAWQPLNW